MNLTAIKNIAQSEMGDKRSSPYIERGDKYTHGERVAALAVRLRELIFPGDSGYDDILTAAAWFHDICNGMTERSQHAILGAQRAKELLAGHCGAGELEQICGVITVHDERRPGDNAYPNAVLLHQDADLLDHLGTLDLWRLALYTAGHDETINDAVDFMRNSWPNNVARWRRELNFDLSKRVFDEKIAFVQGYTERFAVECAGGIWDEGAF